MILLILCVLGCAEKDSKRRAPAVKVAENTQIVETTQEEQSETPVPTSVSNSDNTAKTSPETTLTSAVKEPLECSFKDDEIRYIDGSQPVEYEESPEVGHSHKGGAYDEGPRMPATIWERGFDIDFPAHGCSDTARQLINQGIGQLHGFLNYEVERSFRTAELVDETCAMARVGLVLANSIWIGSNPRGADFLRHAISDKQNASEHIKAYIEALQHLYSPQNSKAGTASRCFAKGLEKVLDTNPGDLDGKAFYALTLWYYEIYDLITDSKKTVERLQKVSDIIDEILYVNPMHPVHHYKIHLWDYSSEDQKALRSADLSGLSSPTIAHMWHMSGHTYIQTKYFLDMTRSQEIAARIDHRYMDRFNVMPYELHNHYHNNEWLARSLFKLGAFKKAEQVAGNLLAVPRHPDKNSNKERGTYASYGPQRLAESWLLSRQWDNIRQAYESDLFTLDELMDSVKAKMLHIITIAFFDAGEERFQNFIGDALNQSISLNERIVDGLKNKNWKQVFSELQEGDGAIDLYLAEKAIADGKFKDAKYILDHHYTYHIGGWTPSFDINHALLRVELELARADSSQEKLKNRLKILFGATQLVDGDSHLARRVSELKNQFPGIKPRFLKRRPVDRTPTNLEPFGDMIWKNKAAPELVVTDVDGKLFHLALQQKPTIVVFSLTEGCALCKTQIANLYENHQKIVDHYNVVILSLDSEDLLQGVAYENMQRFNLTKNPYSLVSLAEQGELPELFKSFRVYDGFENSPLHGVFLVDAGGKIIFEDISYKAFDDVNYLVKEFKRLINPVLNSYR